METFKKWLHVIGIMVLTFLLMDIGVNLAYAVITPLTAQSDATTQFIGFYGMYIGAWVFILAYCLIFKKNRKYLHYLSFKEPGNKLSTILAIGLPCGILLNLLLALCAILHGDIRLTYAQFNLPLLLVFFIVVGIQCGSEELAARWFVYHKIVDIFPDKPWIAFIVSALGFSAIHLNNPGIGFLPLANIALVGILYALIIYYYDSFWAAFLAHTGWNFCQNILLGLPNSGVVSQYSVFKLDTASQANSFAYNTVFGIEGTLMSTIALFLACVVIWYLGSRKKKAL